MRKLLEINNDTPYKIHMYASKTPPLSFPHNVFFFLTFHNKNKAVSLFTDIGKRTYKVKEISILLLFDMINTKSHLSLCNVRAVIK